MMSATPCTMHHCTYQHVQPTHPHGHFLCPWLVDSIGTCALACAPGHSSCLYGHNRIALGRHQWNHHEGTIAPHNLGHREWECTNGVVALRLPSPHFGTISIYRRALLLSILLAPNPRPPFATLDRRQPKGFAFCHLEVLSFSSR